MLLRSGRVRFQYLHVPTIGKSTDIPSKPGETTLEKPFRPFGGDGRGGSRISSHWNKGRMIAQIDHDYTFVTSRDAPFRDPTKP